MANKRYHQPKNKSNSKKGFVYILSNISMPGILKVGMTRRVPELRINDDDLCSTGVPTPFIVEYYAFFDDRYKAEKEAHINLKEYRHSKEFFTVDIPTAIKGIEQVQMDSVEVYPNKGGFNRVVFDNIQKECPKCGRINTIPEYIKHDKRPICAQCHFWLLDKITVVEKIKNVNHIVEVEKAAKVERVESIHETDDFVNRFRESNDRNEYDENKIVFGILFTGIALLLLVYQLRQNYA